MNEQNKNYNICLVTAVYIMLIVTVPYFGVKGSTINTVLKAGLLAAFVIASVVMSGFKMSLSPIGIIAVALFLISQVLSFIFVDGFSLISFLVQFALLFVTLLVIPGIKTDENQIKNGIKVFLAFNFVAIIYNYIKHFRDIVTLNFIKGINYTMYSFFDNKNTYGMILFVGFALLCYLYKLGGFKRKWLFWVLFILQLLSISISRCRTSLLTTGIFISFYFFLSTADQKYKVAVGLLLSVAAVAVFLIPVTRNYILYSIIRIDVGTYRDAIYEGGRELIAASPIFGYGMDNWSDSMKELGGTIYSHNGYNQVLLNGGILYMLGYIFVFFFILRKISELKKTNKEMAKMVLGFFIAFLVYSYFEATVLCGSSAANYSFTLAGIIIPSLLCKIGTEETKSD